MKQNVLKIALLCATVFLASSRQALAATTDTPWAMVGGNPQRTSWTPTEVPGTLKFAWVKPIEPQVSASIQPTAAEGKVFIATAKGLYAFNTANGDQAWVFGTELPLVNSPTYSGGYLYFGGMDKKLYKIRASDKNLEWSFSAEGGFDSNPLVINNTVYAGNRDGYFYAINASTGALVWKYKVGSQILQSAAYSELNGGRLFFGAMDGKAYSLTTSGSLVWSVSLPGMGWTGLWPVIYKDQVIFTRVGSARNSSQDFSSDVSLYEERDWLFGPPPYDGTNPEDGFPAADMNSSSIPAAWESTNKKGDLRTNPIGTKKTVIDFLEQNRHSRSVFFLQQTTGVEATFDLDSDGKLDAAPILRTSSDGQTTYPPMIRGCAGCDSVIYFRNPIVSSGNFSGSMVVGWNYGTPFISFPVSSQGGGSPDWPMDEYTGISGGGNILHWNLIIGRNIGAANLAVPNTTFPAVNTARQWRYVIGAESFPAGYDSQALKFYWEPNKLKPDGSFYYEHGWSMGPTIYDGKVYEITGNALVAFGNSTSSPTVKPAAPTPTQINSEAVSLAPTILSSKLQAEIQKILAVGHLKPAYSQIGTYDSYQEGLLGDHLGDYWANSGETIYTLLQALPLLNEETQTALKAYIKNEYTNFPPYTYSHVGWKDGAYRQPFNWPPEMSTNIAAMGPTLTGDTDFSDWDTPPFNIYAMWKYAQAGLEEPTSVFAQAQKMLSPTITANKGALTDDHLKGMPHVLNAYIAGYIGYIELAKMAQQPYTSYETELNRLKQLRLSQFTINLLPPSNFAIGVSRYYFTLRPAMNYLYMVPELAEYLVQNQNGSVVSNAVKVNTDELAYPALGSNNGSRSSFWMIGHNRDPQGENGLTPYQHTMALFFARAHILKDSQTKLAKLIDTPITTVGDIGYIQNLITTLNAGEGGVTPPPSICSPKPGDIDGSGKVTLLDLTALIGQYGSANKSADLNCDEKVNMIDISILIGNI